ncbi:hypothetical protein GK047_15325 [Paenibacillus sp. SYP-B3998]|uniref:Uncharacterized protein n=1 Tax=Paenibacillus sp. SYP-B3998 TaxID=2678564 RepID=A0A6G4A0A9_9BACL|nr:hypothetical protein [Paenibacillus sp. SYP-B3998]NEW07374.1 hypothetical protein [Paenibacillus sp. SYP-B3998]
MKCVSKLSFRTEVLEKIKPIRLVEHIDGIICSESNDTQIQYKSYETEDYNSLALVTKNEYEGYSHLHFFYLDKVDQAFNQYLYFSMPVSNLKVLFKQTKSWLL